MAGAEVSNLKGVWISGELHFQTLAGVDVVVIGATTGLRAFPAGTYKTATTATTLALTDSGKIVQSSVDGTIFTLPALASTTMGVNYTIINSAAAGQAAIIVLAGATTNVFVGAGFSSTALAYQLTNTKATAKPGDSLSIQSLSDPTNNPIWSILGLTGTWVSTT